MSNRNRRPRPHETPKLKGKQRRKAESEAITRGRYAFLAFHRSGVTSGQFIRDLARRTRNRKEREL